MCKKIKDMLDKNIISIGIVRFIIVGQTISYVLLANS